MDKARVSVEMQDFPGMMPALDARQLPAGASEEQVNVTCVNTGELDGRHGYRLVKFENVN